MQLQRDEGYRQRLYQDTMGHWTIGHGRNLESDGIDREEAAWLLNRDIRKRIAAIRRRLPWTDSLDPARFGALVNLSFAGMATLLTFRKMLRALEARDYATAAEELLDSRYAEQVGGRARRLARQVRTGEWT